MRLIALLLLTWLAPLALTAQEENPYAIYLRQITQLMNTRGLDNDEIERVLSVYRDNQIRSDSDFAALLHKLYPEDQGILVLFYQWYNDTLRRVAFVPGAVREIKTIPVKAKAVLQLGSDFNHVLGLYKASGNRMPVKRGAVVNPPPPSKGLRYDSLVQKATRLLLPAWFDARWQHLIIIPALNIGTLPFHLLEPYGNKTQLIDHCSFSVAPAVGDLVALRMKILKAMSTWNGDLRVPFADNYRLSVIDSMAYNLDHPLFISNPAYPTNTEYSFPNLPGAQKEIEQAIPFAGSYVLLQGKAAQKDSVLKYLGEADVAYFATHGIASAEDPMRKSFLVLSGKDPFLTAKDIMDARKTLERFPDLVILSACQTGLGRSMEAGVAGLARSFMLAGANHVLMSLWNVDDEATAYLMNRFLFHMRQRSLFLPAEPLRKAMLDARKKFSRASQWAGFSLFGVNY